MTEYRSGWWNTGQCEPGCCWTDEYAECLAGPDSVQHILDEYALYAKYEMYSIYLQHLVPGSEDAKQDRRFHVPKQPLLHPMHFGHFLYFEHFVCIFVIFCILDIWCILDILTYYSFWLCSVFLT